MSQDKLKFYFPTNLAGAKETTFPRFHQYGPYVCVLNEIAKASRDLIKCGSKAELLFL